MGLADRCLLVVLAIYLQSGLRKGGSEHDRLAIKVNYLSYFISLANPINIPSCNRVLLAKDYWIHGTRFSLESRDSSGVSSGALNLTIH